MLEKLNGDKERRSKLIEEIVCKSFKIQNELTDRKDWDKYLSQKQFERVMRLARCGEEAAKKASEEFGVEVIRWMPHTPEEHNHFYSIFNPRGMSREQKFEEIRKRIDAVCRAVAIYYRSRPKYHKSLFYG